VFTAAKIEKDVFEKSFLVVSKYTADFLLCACPPEGLR